MIFKTLLILFCLTIHLNALTKQVEVVGNGFSKQEAIYNGLIEAVRQVNGITIASKVKTSFNHIDFVSNESEGTISKNSIKKDITTLTNGQVQSYKIIDNTKSNDEYNTKLLVNINIYKTPGLSPHNRRKMAIMPFEFKNNYYILNNSESGKQVSQRFTQALVTKITQARKFTVLDRENSKYYEAEKNFLLSGNSSQDELLKLGKKLGTDYLLIGQMLDLSIENITETSNIGLPSTTQLICNATISYRIIMMATQQVKWSETISKQFVIEENSNMNSKEAIVANATDKISGLILTNILNNIFPPRIITVTQNSVIINQGGNSMDSGSIYKAFGYGQRLVDPYTKEFLGYEEIEAGEIEITTVNPKVSYAKILSGKVTKGMILRKIKSNENNTFSSEGEAVTDVVITPNGGVVLPF